jgi:branched-chain amino acid transport system ATP-binding protein
MADSAAAVATRPQTATAPILAVRDLHAWYGESHVLHGISFDVFPGEVVTVEGGAKSGHLAATDQGPQTLILG